MNTGGIFVTVYYVPAEQREVQGKEYEIYKK